MACSKKMSQMKQSRGIRVIQEMLKTLPKGSGVYRMIGAQGVVLYVGKAKNLRNRVASYTQVQQLPQRLQRMVHETREMAIVTTRTESEALLLESNLIQKLKPKYNVVLKDHRSMAYIFLGQGKWPVLRQHRGSQITSGDYFGPFPSRHDVWLTLSSLQRAFLLRSCTDHFFNTRKRPCLQYDLKRCSAPCVGKISPSDYQELVKSARQFLSGGSQSVQKTLIQQMDDLSRQQLYEQALRIRDRIRAITQLQARQTIFCSQIKDADVIAVAQRAGHLCLQMFFFRGGGNYGTQSVLLSIHTDITIEKILETSLSQFYQKVPPPPLLLLNEPLTTKTLLQEALGKLAPYGVRIETPQKGPLLEVVQHAYKNAEDTLTRYFAHRESQDQLLKRLQHFCELPDIPKRIEIYDNSHIQGKHAYGAMVVATPEGFLTKAYRKFKIPSSVNASDDYGMMRAVFQRRFQEDTVPENKPQLILIDGGKGHLNTVQKVLQGAELSIPLLAVAKGPNRHAGCETLYRLHKTPQQLSPEDPLLYYIQRLRDEAHRFAITTHRNRRSKDIRHSKLDAIPAIGKARKTALLRHFGSLQAIQEASISDLCRTPGISRHLAEKVYEHFQSSV